MGIFSFIGSIFKPAADLIDSIHTSEEEKLIIKNELAKMQFEMQSKVLEYETKLMESKASIISAEAKSGYFITSAWRPIVMLTFAGIIVARWFGLTADNISAELESQLFDIIQLGIGGYIMGRSGEKIAKELKSKKD
jgi:hypothetical protein